VTVLVPLTPSRFSFGRLPHAGAEQPAYRDVTKTPTSLALLLFLPKQLGLVCRFLLPPLADEFLILDNFHGFCFYHYGLSNCGDSTFTYGNACLKLYLFFSFSHSLFFFRQKSLVFLVVFHHPPPPPPPPPPPNNRHLTLGGLAESLFLSVRLGRSLT